jgi:hypothetical protein
MKKSLLLASLAALLVTGCGRGQRNDGSPSEQQKSDLDNAAAMVDDNQSVIDTSPDSLTLPPGGGDIDLNGTAPGNQAAPVAPPADATGAAPAPAPNAAAPVRR